VLCHQESHIVTSECGAPEFFGGGLKLVGLPGEGAKVAADTLRNVLAAREWGGPHHVTPAVLSLTQASEAGTIYQLDDLVRLSGIAHGHGMSVHIDGARFANALVTLGATPAQATWKCGVDVLSFGATKGGAMAAEAVVFFDKARGAAMGERRKRGGQLVSKHRFIAAQFEAYFAGDLWLTLARHANRLAARLAERLSAAGFAPVWPVEANLVFVVLPQAVDQRLRAAGASYYAMHREGLPASVTINPGDVLARLVTSFATTEPEVDRFAALAAGA
jgi:threonine aldolase